MIEKICIQNGQVFQVVRDASGTSLRPVAEGKLSKEQREWVRRMTTPPPAPVPSIPAVVEVKYPESVVLPEIQPEPQVIEPVESAEPVAEERAEEAAASEDSAQNLRRAFRRKNKRNFNEANADEASAEVTSESEETV